MSKQPSRHAKLSDYAAYAVYRGVEFFLRLLPMEAVSVVGATLGTIAYHTMKQRRQVVIRNLRIVYGKSISPGEIKSLARKTFQLSGANLISSIPASVMSSSELLDRVELQGREHLQDAIGQGHGCIFLLAHMGNWEILTQLRILAPEIKSLASLYRPLDNPLLDRLIKRRRQKKGADLFSRTEGFTKSITHLKEGGCLGVIADQHAGSKGLAVPLFGKLTSMTNLPALLHRKTKAPILPISMCTVSPGKWKVIFHPALQVFDESRKDAYKLTCQTAKAYESMMLESPADVLWMHGYWKTGRKRPLKIYGMKGKKTGTELPNKPFRIIVYTGMANKQDQELLEQLERLEHHRPDIHITTAGKYPLLLSADHHIYYEPADPPHLISHKIHCYDQHCSAPLDCALDFTKDGSGGKLLVKAGLNRVFCRHGKWMNSYTQAAFANYKSSDISLLLTSLGLDDDNNRNMECGIDAP